MYVCVFSARFLVITLATLRLDALTNFVLRGGAGIIYRDWHKIDISSVHPSIDLMDTRALLEPIVSIVYIADELYLTWREVLFNNKGMNCMVFIFYCVITGNWLSTIPGVVSWRILTSRLAYPDISNIIQTQR